MRVIHPRMIYFEACFESALSFFFWLELDDQLFTDDDATLSLISSTVYIFSDYISIKSPIMKSSPFVTSIFDTDPEWSISSHCQSSRQICLSFLRFLSIRSTRLFLGFWHQTPSRCNLLFFSECQIFSVLDFSLYEIGTSDREGTGISYNFRS